MTSLTIARAYGAHEEAVALAEPLAGGPAAVIEARRALGVRTRRSRLGPRRDREGRSGARRLPPGSSGARGPGP